MKTINFCSNCLRQHNWREIDYDNVLFINEKNAVCLTLCQSCVSKFLENQLQKSSAIRNYKQRINNMLLADKNKSVHNNNVLLEWFEKIM